MGMLAETKSRRKLNHDPNNTKWSRDTTTFGQKILRSQGWQPGEYLGVQDAAHSEFHTAANASYIRVSLKDDMKGLGFDKRKEDEVTGLNEFSDLLSRLNGKSTKSVEQEKAKRLEVKMSAYVQHRYGAMRFVRGGLLVGDELKKDDENEATSETVESDEGSSGTDEVSEKKQEEAPPSSKKRKAMDDDEEDLSSSSSSSEEEESRKKRRKKEKKEKAKPKKDKHGKSKSKKPSASPTDTDDEDEAKKANRARKEEKRAKKELKRARKEEKKLKKKRKVEAESDASEFAAATTATATPVMSGASTPRINNPHRVRSRFLAAKREALMDQKALDKIWMVKT
ncbi:uncharacterized protein J7T54_000094 [Emericellopsis cladophorae]|uniref:PinX1-related protein 1 n=1 Tax=Emericellopsis cladophorae TaxID=2686198 RepID=A0A9P9XZ04_9HYPO|nr:uncharacterized protein J7T54_000094 [Emericellopsis cladophorae]KAI6780188.1 hypothetical protein J7T54_000094 [Emericellopsis cladophorae]